MSLKKLTTTTQVVAVGSCCFGAAAQYWSGHGPLGTALLALALLNGCWLVGGVTK